MSLLKFACVILTVVSLSSASIGPHYDFAPNLQFAAAPLAYGPSPPPLFAPPVLPPPLLAPPVLPPTVLPHPVLPAPVFHAPAPEPLWTTPLLPAPAPLWPAPSPVSFYPTHAQAPWLPAPLPLPLPLTRPLPPVFDPLPFAPPAYRAIPGPVTKTHHVSLGFAYPAKVIAAPAPHVHPLKLVTQPSHAHIHAHSAPLINLPHHHHHHAIA